jgi:predicted permease
MSEIIRIVLSIGVVLLAAAWLRRTLPLAPRAATRVFRLGSMAMASGLAGYLLLFIWYGVLRRSFGLLAVLVFVSIGLSAGGIVLLGAARQARRAQGERARPIF